MLMQEPQSQYDCVHNMFVLLAMLLLIFLLIQTDPIYERSSRDDSSRSSDDSSRSGDDGSRSGDDGSRSDDDSDSSIAVPGLYFAHRDHSVIIR